MISLVFAQFCICLKLIGDSFDFLVMWVILVLSNAMSSHKKTTSNPGSVCSVYIIENILSRVSMSTPIPYDLTCTSRCVVR